MVSVVGIVYSQQSNRLKGNGVRATRPAVVPQPEGSAHTMMRIRDRFDRSKRKPSTRNQRLGFAMFWLIVISYAYFISSAASFNAESHLYPAFSLVDHHTLNIDRYATRLGDKSYWDGHYYTDKAPGLSFLAVPVYAALRIGFPGHIAKGYTAVGKVQYSIPKDTVYIRYAITYFLLIVPSAIFAILFWLFLSKFIAPRWAMGLAITYALGTLAFPYSAWYFSHQLAAIMLFSAFLLLFSYVRYREPDTRAERETVFAGFLAGYAIISEYPTALIVVALAGYLGWVARRKGRALALFFLGMIPPALLNVAYNLDAYGKVFATGYTYVHSALYRSHATSGPLGLPNPASYGVQAPSFDSIWQITFGTYRGIFLVSPVLLLFFAGLIAMWKRRELRAEWVLCAVVVAGYFLMDAARPENVNGWSGGWSIASRHLTPMLPFMVFPIVFALKRRAGQVWFLVLAAWSIAVMYLIMASGSGAGFAYGDRNPLVNEVWRRLQHGHIEVNWGYLLYQTGVPSLIPLVLLVLAFSFRIAWLFGSPKAPAVARERFVSELEAM